MIADCFTFHEKSYSCLVMDYIHTAEKQARHNLSLVKELVKLHQCTSEQYGLEFNNYLGVLDQSNNHHHDLFSFYSEERISPQFEVAYDLGYLKNLKINLFFKNIKSLLPANDIHLIHGDLWAGNVLYAKAGETYLIDPAISYGHREFDLAMMTLFGGFDNEVFRKYNELMPLEKGWEDRTKLFQLYYLMAHLNMFGRSYEASVSDIIKKYS